MKAAAVDVFLSFAFLSAWLGCLAFPRFANALDRLHCVAFINAAVGITITLAVFAQDGLSTRSLKTLAVLLLQLIIGAATIHASGRALITRDEAES